MLSNCDFPCLTASIIAANSVFTALLSPINTVASWESALLHIFPGAIANAERNSGFIQFPSKFLAES